MNVSQNLMANAIRFLSVDAIQKANSGHPGMPMGIADVVSILFSKFIKIYPNDPLWPNRDRFVLSAGHGSMVLYSVMWLMGFLEPSLDDIKNFRNLHSKAPGHPEFGLTSGIDATTGPLGQGFANAVGMAIAERAMHTRFGFIDHYVYSIVGDGCLMEGISHESASLAGHLGLNNLIVFFDNNGISIDGSTELTISDDYEQRFLSYNWHVLKVDGHNYEEISIAIKQAQLSDKPTIIICDTIIAYGSPNKANSAAAHGSPIGIDELVAMRKNLSWPYEPFEIPDKILTAWRNAGKRCEQDYLEWHKVFKNHSLKNDFEHFLSKSDLQGQKIDNVLHNLKKIYAHSQPAEATRKSSGAILANLNEVVANFIGGSADLSISNCTITPGSKPITKDDFSGNYIHYGIREHAMAAIMNGLAFYGGFVPYGGTFLVFSDYCRPSIRLSAMVGLQVIYVMTHDSIGVGEDGPTHQPVEHLASLRAIPNLFVFRPADASETVDCWRMAMSFPHSPSVIVLSRQSVNHLSVNTSDNMVSKGMYVVYGNAGSNKIDVVLFASGSDVSIAISVADVLKKQKDLSVWVISCPCLELFNYNDISYRERIVGSGSSLQVVIESASSFGWGHYVKKDAIFCCVDRFGVSAPADKIYNYFQITTDKIVGKIMQRFHGKH
ncbi:Transketolase [Candidatus Xenohaliotis californiensis]|uniref:Transketolase n=1 Tax=Candidatus Xenohaliotis californiensis TaxID=84677 RepID=A0ABP0ES21_9RICK|nr:Transketolase [Candidatus Xenohaliotis californiensis]